MHDSLTPKEFGNVLVNFLINYRYYDHTFYEYKISLYYWCYKVQYNVNG